MTDTASITSLGEILFSHPAVDEIVAFLTARGVENGECRIVLQDKVLLQVDVNQRHRRKKPGGET